MSVLLDALKKAEKDNKAHTQSIEHSMGEVDLSEEAMDLPESLDGTATEKRFFKVSQDVTLPQNSEAQNKQLWFLLAFAVLIFAVVILFARHNKDTDIKSDVEPPTPLASHHPSAATPEEKPLARNENTKPATLVAEQNAALIQNALPQKVADKKPEFEINQPAIKKQNTGEQGNTQTKTLATLNPNTTKDAVKNTANNLEKTAQKKVVAAANNKKDVRYAQKSNTSNTKKVKKPIPKKMLSIKRAKTLTMLINEGYALYQKGEYGSSLSKYSQAYRKSPSNKDALLGMVATHTKLGQPDLANVYRQKLNALGLGVQRASVNLGGTGKPSDRPTYRAQHHPNSLLEQLKKNPRDARLNFALATAFAKKGDWVNAQNYYFKAHQFAPTNPNYAFNLAVSLEHLGHAKTALRFYEKTKKLMRSSPSSVNPMTVAKRLDALSQRFDSGLVSR